MPRGKQKAEQPATEQATKFRKVIDDGADELVCPITQELPVDPVTAEDGRVYERSAIEGWFASRPEDEVKSPITNELMGKKLLPAVQVRNTIKAMVESGALSGDKADAWKKRLAEEQEVIDWQKKAEGGDVEAMLVLGIWHRDAKWGLTKDRKKAFAWHKKAADLDHPTALATCGLCYIFGEGVEVDVPRGFMMLGQAAALGSDYACYQLGHTYAHGTHRAKKDRAEAAKWYRRMDGCRYKSCDNDKDIVAEVAEWLREYDGETGA